MSIADRWADRLTSEMARKRNVREREVGAPTWRLQVERYGIETMMAEVLSITARLEQMLWSQDARVSIDRNPDRALDLLADLGNYAGFIYEHVYETTLNKELIETYKGHEEDDSPQGENPGNISPGPREQGEHE